MRKCGLCKDDKFGDHFKKCKYDCYVSKKVSFAEVVTSNAISGGETSNVISVSQVDFSKLYGDQIRAIIFPNNFDSGKRAAKSGCVQRAAVESDVEIGAGVTEDEGMVGEEGFYCKKCEQISPTAGLFAAHQIEGD